MKFKSHENKQRDRNYAQPTLRFLPLGGMGTVTRNLYVYEYFDPKKPNTSDILLIDCGIGFPEEEMLGVDLVLPDISYLRKRKDRLRGLVITHGHMDHIGAIPYVVPELGVPVYATRLTTGFIKTELKERGVENQCQVIEIDRTSVLNLGPFEVSFIYLSHSVPDTTGIAIKCPAGSFFHTGDFKFDWTPVPPEPRPQVGRLAQLGDEGLDVLVTDCLRIENPGYTLSESDISKTFDSAMRQAKGRVLITTFSSNISRIQQAIDVSKKYNRKVCFVGRSMENYSQVASELKYLNVKNRDIVKIQQLNELRPNQVTLLVAGSQGQRFSALSRIGRGEHRFIRLKKNDTVIFSSDSIPGNEEAVNDLIDRLILAGARVIYSAVSDALHVSGHASREELKLLLGLTRPRHVVPISGSFRHMKLMADLAVRMGVSEENTFVLKNGETLEITKKQVTRGSNYELDDVLIDGSSIGEVGKLIIEDRQILSDDGLVMIIVLVDENSKKVKVVDVITRGFVYEEGDKNKRLRNGLRGVVTATLAKHTKTWGNKEKIDAELAKAIKNYIFKKTQLRPMILPVVMGC